MPVLLLAPARQDHGGAEEGDLVDVGEEDGHARVQAEDAHPGEVCDGTDAEGEGVGDGGDGDGDGGLGERLAHPLLHCHGIILLAPGGQHHEHVVHTNT